MAARLNNRHQQMIRDKIRGSQLVNVLEKHIFNEYKKNEKPLDPSRINACLGLLKKVLPDLSATEIDARVDDTRPETMPDADLYLIAQGKK